MAYVDHDPIAVVHAGSLLDSDPLTTVIEADLREPDKVLGHPRLQRLIDPGVIYLPLWRSDERTTDGTPADGYATYAAVARL